MHQTHIDPEAPISAGNFEVRPSLEPQSLRVKKGPMLTIILLARDQLLRVMFFFA